MIWVERQALERVLVDELGYNINHPLEFLCGGDTRPSEQAWLARNLIDIVVQLTRLEGPEVHWRYLRQLERSLLVNLLTALPHTYRQELDRTEHQVAPFYVHRVETFIRQHFAEPITAQDILRVAGTSARTLFYGFRKYRATTPMRSLKQLRLQEARRQLLGAADVGRWVTKIALECGFSDLSMFARDYRRRYGETPSETSKRGDSIM
jgi:AraC-like DNA-binding protein